MVTTTAAPESPPAALEAPRANPYVQTLGGVLVAVLTTSVSAVLGASATTNLVVAVLGAVLPALVTYVGPWRRLRLGVAVAAAVAALFVTFGGLTLFDAAAEKQVVPWSPEPEPTAVPGGGGVSGGGGGTQGQPVSVTPAVDCTTDGCSPDDVEVSNNGTEPVEVFAAEVVDDPAGAFTVSQDCAGQTLEPGDSCSFPVQYTPQSEPTAATLLVDHDGGQDPSEVRLTGSGESQAVTGNVFFFEDPTCEPAADGSFIVTATVAADEGDGQVDVAVLAAGQSLGAAFTVDQPGTVSVPETANGSEVQVRIDPNGTIEGDNLADNGAVAICAA